MKNKILLIVSILFGLMFINSGLNKLFQYMPMPEDLPAELIKLMTTFNDIGWLFPLVAVVEIVGGLLFMTNRFRALGAIIILPVMVGIVLTHIYNAPSGLVLAFILFAINLWVIYENRHKYKPLFK